MPHARLLRTSHARVSPTPSPFAKPSSGVLAGDPFQHLPKLAGLVHLLDLLGAADPARGGRRRPWKRRTRRRQYGSFKRVAMGLRAHSEFRIDPARAPNGYLMIDFTKFMRSAFSVDRKALAAIGGGLSARKPRLLIVSRNNKSRAFTNADEIVEMAEEMGFEVVVDGVDVSFGLARFARVVNSCDVMMGVLRTGLTNMVFLPRNATIIQNVPWGGLEWLAAANFGDPAKAMGLNYVEYSVRMEESNLSGEYPKDHPVFTDPLSFHNRRFRSGGSEAKCQREWRQRATMTKEATSPFYFPPYL